jgi:hypothetical protein
VKEKCEKITELTEYGVTWALSSLVISRGKGIIQMCRVPDGTELFIKVEVAI